MTDAARQPDWTIECLCCGDDAAWGMDDDMVSDGQPLACGCKGHISCDTESEPDVFVDDCECGR